jgi:hypothetical protein
MSLDSRIGEERTKRGREGRRTSRDEASPRRGRFIGRDSVEEARGAASGRGGSGGGSGGGRGGFGDLDVLGVIMDTGSEHAKERSA